MFTGLEDSSELLVTDACRAVEQLADREPFHVIFMDPPYRQGLERQVLERMDRTGSCVGKDTLILVEASLDTDFQWIETSGFEISRIKKYKTNAHLFLRRRER